MSIFGKVGHAVDWALGKDKDAKARAKYEQAEKGYQDINLPSMQDMQLQQAGLLTPDALGPSALAGVHADPEAVAAQKRALAELSGIVSNKGLSATSQANLAHIASDQAAQERGAREAIAAQARARGVGGGGLEFMLSNQAGQAAANRGAQSALDVAAQQEQGLRAAVGQLAQTGGQVREQDYGEKARAAQAADQIAQFNNANRNQAQAYNLGEAQRISDTNHGLYQQNYQNQLQKQDRLANTYNLQGQYWTNEAEKHRKRFSDMGQAATNFAGNIAQEYAPSVAPVAMAAASDKRLKKDVKDGGTDIEALLRSIAPKSFSYKDEKNGKGPQLGIMAQDLEKTPGGKAAVIETDEGKMVDGSKAALLALAGVAHLSKKMKGGK